MFGGGMSSGMKGLEKQLFQLKMTSKQLSKLSKKCEKDEKTEKDKIRKALEKDNHEGECREYPYSCGLLRVLTCARSSSLHTGGRIHAQNAIRAKNNAQNYLRLSSRVDAVSSRLESAIKMQQVTKSMGAVVKGMDKVLGSMNVEKISKVMDQFEQSFEDMDVASEYVEGAMNSSTTAAMPEEQVDELMHMVADEHGLKMGDVFQSACGADASAASAQSEPAAMMAAGGGGGGGGSGGGGGGGAKPNASIEDDLEERLRKLRAS